MNSIRTLAIRIYDRLQPNASFATIEERVWMLKTRHISDGLIASIIEEEFTTTQQPTTAPAPPSITVESLPSHLDRTDWR